jgi:hypothetical protein
MMPMLEHMTSELEALEADLTEQKSSGVVIAA